MSRHLEALEKQLQKVAMEKLVVVRISAYVGNCELPSWIKELEYWRLELLLIVASEKHFEFGFIEQILH